MIHQPSRRPQGTAADIEIQAKEILYLRQKMNTIYSKHTGRPVEQIERDMIRDLFMSAEEAKDYGLIDNVITHRRRDRRIRRSIAAQAARRASPSRRSCARAGLVTSRSRAPIVFCLTGSESDHC